MIKELNPRQREDLTEQFVEIVVDNMSEKDLVRYAQEQLIDAFNQYSLEELKEDIDNNDEELWDELVDNVTQQYPKQLNTFEKETFIDINNTGGKF